MPKEMGPHFITKWNAPKGARAQTIAVYCDRKCVIPQCSQAITSRRMAVEGTIEKVGLRIPKVLNSTSPRGIRLLAG